MVECEVQLHLQFIIGHRPRSKGRKKNRQFEALRLEESDPCRVTTFPSVIVIPYGSPFLATASSCGSPPRHQMPIDVNADVNGRDAKDGSRSIISPFRKGLGRQHLSRIVRHAVGIGGRPRTSEWSYRCNCQCEPLPSPQVLMVVVINDAVVIAAGIIQAVFPRGPHVRSVRHVRPV